MLYLWNFEMAPDPGDFNFPSGMLFITNISPESRHINTFGIFDFFGSCNVGACK